MTTKPTLTPSQALALLKEGNARYVCAKTEGPNRTKKRRVELAEKGQSPICALVSCSDSRVPPEILFDMGLGDLFVIRVAGNICGFSEMGSLEYAVEHLGVPLVTILGHTKCGAVTAVVKDAHVDGNLLTIAERIAPCVMPTKSAKAALPGDLLVDECAKANVFGQIERLFKESSAVREAARAGTVQVIGAFYDIEHGDVAWLGRHPHEAGLFED